MSDKQINQSPSTSARADKKAGGDFREPTEKKMPTRVSSGSSYELRGYAAEGLGDYESDQAATVSTLRKKSSVSMPVKDTKTNPIKKCVPLASVASKTSADVIVFPADLPAFDNAAVGLQTAMKLLNSEEWNKRFDGLTPLVQLLRHHNEQLHSQVPQICFILGELVPNLRSQVSRAACQASFELFTHLKGVHELNLNFEELAIALLNITANTSAFLRSDADKALLAMCTAITPNKLIQLMTERGVGHVNVLVRKTVAKILYTFVVALGVDTVLQLHVNTRNKFLKCIGTLLTDAGLETRQHIKAAIKLLREYPKFYQFMQQAVPSKTYALIEKSLHSI